MNDSMLVDNHVEEEIVPVKMASLDAGRVCDVAVPACDADAGSLDEEGVEMLLSRKELDEDIARLEGDWSGDDFV